MREFKAQVGSYIDIPTKSRYSGPTESTVAVIILQPPFLAIGEGFKRVILGQVDIGMDLKYIASTPDKSVFIAESHNLYPDVRKSRLNQVAQRIERFARSPALAVTMMYEEPFSDSTGVYHR